MKDSFAFVKSVTSPPTHITPISRTSEPPESISNPAYDVSSYCTPDTCIALLKPHFEGSFT